MGARVQIVLMGQGGRDKKRSRFPQFGSDKRPINCLSNREKVRPRDGSRGNWKDEMSF